MIRTAIVGVAAGILIGSFIFRCAEPVVVNDRQAAIIREPVVANLRGHATIELPVLGISKFEIQEGKGVSQANADKIVEGMTATEIGNILGGPPGDLTWKKRWFECRIQGRPLTDQEKLDFWMDDNGVIEVFFNEGRAISWQYFPWRQTAGS